MGNEKNNRQKWPLWAKLMIAVLAVLLVLVVTAGILISSKLSLINRATDVLIDPSDATDETDTDGEDTISESDLAWGDLADATAVEGVVNVLLVGTDDRTDTYNGRTDSIMLLSINSDTNEISMVSLMRDMYVQIGDGTQYNNSKLNAAFRYGGFSLLEETIENNFGVEVDYYVGINFAGFAEVIDILGGVEIELSKAEVEYLSGNSKYSNKGGGLNDTNDFTGLTVGVNTLNGDEALAYARIRYVPNERSGLSNDFGRTYRQRYLLTQLYDKMMKQSWTELWSLADEILPNITTDMTNKEIMTVALEAYNMGLDEISTHSVPTSGYSDQTIRGMSVLVIDDWDAIREELKGYLYGNS